MERWFFIFVVASLLLVGVLTGIRVYVLHDYDFYTEPDQIPDQVAEFEAQYLPFLLQKSTDTGTE